MKLERALVAATAAVLFLGAGPAAAQDFTWSGAIPQGRAVEIKGVNGDVRAEPSGSNQVEVVAVKSARRDDPASVRIQVVPHDGGVTICAVYPTREGARPNECAPGDGGRNNVQNNDVTVRFTVRVPAGVTFIGKTVNGDVEATRLNGDVVINREPLLVGEYRIRDVREGPDGFVYLATDNMYPNQPSPIVRLEPAD